MLYLSDIENILIFNVTFNTFHGHLICTTSQPISWLSCSEMYFYRTKAVERHSRVVLRSRGLSQKTLATEAVCNISSAPLLLINGTWLGVGGHDSYHYWAFQHLANWPS